MKLFFFVLSLVSTSALATSSMVGDFPKIQFGSVFVSVEHVCVSGERIETQAPVPVCVEWGRGETSYCSKEIKRILSTPIHYSKEVPRGEGGFEMVEFSIPLTYKIPFGYYSEGGVTPVFTKKYSIPGCE